MSKIKQMPAPSNEPNDNQIAEERKKRAQGFFEEIKGSAGVYSRSSLLIGYCAYILKEENLFGILGYSNEDEAREAAGVGSSTWYATIRMAQAFKDLPRELFVSMKLSNCSALSDLPEAKRLDREWVTKAAEMSIKEFRKAVDEEMNGKSKPSDGRERTATMRLDMPASRKTVIEEKARDFAESHGIDVSDTAKAIEIALVEATDGPTMVGAIVNAVERLRRVKELCESGLSSDEVLAQVLELNEASIIELANVLRIKGKEEEEAA